TSGVLPEKTTTTAGRLRSGSLVATELPSSRVSRSRVIGAIDSIVNLSRMDGSDPKTTADATRGASIHPGQAWDRKGPRFADGEIVGHRYRVVRFIARGGMGEVYEADDLELATRIALKSIAAERSKDGPALDRFKREIQLARKITHANICRIFDVGYD